MNRFSMAFRIIIGLPTFMAGNYLAIVSVHQILNSEVGLTRLLVAGGSGLVLATIGGFIMSDVIADRIGKGVAATLLPFLNMLPGGRRRGDPPATDAGASGSKP